MKGVSFVTDEMGKRRFAQIDLEELAKYSHEAFEDLLDFIISEARKGEKSAPWEGGVTAELMKEGNIGISDSNKAPRSSKMAAHLSLTK